MRGTIMRQFLYGIGLLVAAAVLVWIDQSPPMSPTKRRY